VSVNAMPPPFQQTLYAEFFSNLLGTPRNLIT